MCAAEIGRVAGSCRRARPVLGWSRLPLRNGLAPAGAGLGLVAGGLTQVAASLVSASLLRTGCAPPSRPPAAGDEIVFINARVWTMATDPARARADALAVRGGRIVAVGSAGQALSAVGPAARVVDLRGAAILPGFIDAHIHLLWIGERLLRSPDGAPLAVDLSPSRSASQAAARVIAQARALPEGS